MTRFASLDALEAHALNPEFTANQRVQIRAGDNDVTADGSRLSLWEVQFATERVEDFQGEEGDLAFVVFLEVEEPIASDTAASDALGLSHFDHWVLTSGLSVVAKEVVARGDE